jgi:hypothetical protein
MSRTSKPYKTVTKKNRKLMLKNVAKFIYFGRTTITKINLRNKLR